jgi:hypothetical protein
MRSIHVVMVALALTGPLPILAQSEAPTSPDSTVPAPKKHGLFGKVKSLSKNKVVNQIAKVALCTAVPGGQVIAGALEAKENKNVAAGAATALSGGKSSCMPGMNGLAGSAGVPGMPGASSGAGMSAAQLKQMQAQGTPGAGMSAAQMRELEAQYLRMGVSPAQIKAMQQQMGALPQPQAAADADAVTAGASYGGLGTPALTKEKNRLVVRQLPWMPGSEGVIEGAGPTFGLAMRDLAAAILATSTRYKVEVRVEDQGGKSENKALARKRSEAVLAALTAEGIPAERLTASDGGGDKDPRTVVSETK